MTVKETRPLVTPAGIGRWPDLQGRPLDENLDGGARRRAAGTAVVVLAPRPGVHGV